MADFNEQVASRITRHAVDLERFKGQARADVVSMLTRLESALKSALYDNDPNGVTRTVYQQARLVALLRQTQETLRTLYRDIHGTMTTMMEEFAHIEAEFALSVINSIAGVELASVALSPEQLKYIAGNTIIDGAPSADWWARQAADVTAKFVDTVRDGMLRGDTTDKIARAVRNDVVGGAARDAEALVRSSIQAVSSAVRVETYKENADVVQYVQQRSVLDSRTTPICQAYSGKIWELPSMKPVGHSLPFINSGGSSAGCPRHWGCRGGILPIVKAFAAMKNLQTGGRPSADADAYFRSRLEARGMSEEEIARVVRNAQASMNGQVPKDWNYETWLRSRPVSEQQEILGPGKWKLWNAGQISFTDLVNQDGRPLTLAELQAKVRRAS